MESRELVQKKGFFYDESLIHSRTYVDTFEGGAYTSDIEENRRFRTSFPRSERVFTEALRARLCAYRQGR